MLLKLHEQQPSLKDLVEIKYSLAKVYFVMNRYEDSLLTLNQLYKLTESETDPELIRFRNISLAQMALIKT